MRKYSFFDYLKVTAILHQLQRLVAAADETPYYHTDVFNLNTVVEDEFNSFEKILDKKSFRRIDEFGIVFSGFYLGESETPLFSFYMYEDHCEFDIAKIDLLNYSVYCLDNKQFDEICLEEIFQDDSWKIVLYSFIEKIKMIMNLDIKIKNETMPGLN